MDLCNLFLPSFFLPNPNNPNHIQHVCKRKICKLHKTNTRRIMWSGFCFDIFPLESYFSNGTYYIPSEYESGVFLSEKKCFNWKFFFLKSTNFLLEYGFFYRQNFFLLVWNFFHAYHFDEIWFLWLEKIILMEYDFCDWKEIILMEHDSWVN